MLTEKEIDRLNGILKNKPFKYNQGVFHYDLEGENDFDFKFQLDFKCLLVKISMSQQFKLPSISVSQPFQGPCT